MKLNFIFIVFTFLLFSCKTKNDQSELANLLKNEPYKIITDSISKFPKADTLYINRGILLSKNKLNEAAQIDFDAAWNLNKSETAGMFVGAGLINLQKYKEAIAFYISLSEKYQDNLELRERLGYCFEQINKPNEAINQYDYILKKDSSNFIIMATKAYALQQLNNDAEAVKWFEKSYNILPNKTVGNELALMYAVAKNPKTIPLCTQLLQEDSSDNANVQPLYALGLYYKNIGNTTKAMQLFDQCIQEDYTYPYPYLDKSIILYDQKKYDEAVKLLTIAQQNDNKNSEVYFQMGKCKQALGDKTEAIKQYESALALDPDYEDAKTALASLQK